MWKRFRDQLKKIRAKDYLTPHLLKGSQVNGPKLKRYQKWGLRSRQSERINSIFILQNLVNYFSFNHPLSTEDSDFQSTEYLILSTRQLSQDKLDLEILLA